MIFIYIFNVGTILFTLNTFILSVIIVENSYVDFFIGLKPLRGTVLITSLNIVDELISRKERLIIEMF